jgi:acyl-CoA reductase-like NAD-dependent aldehyde dehydrogenase
MADQIPMIIGDERVASDESIEVRSPFDGSTVGTVAKGTEQHLDQAVAIAAALHRAGPLPAHERAAVLDRAARLLAERVEEFATVISAEAAKPIKTARVEAARAVDTVSFSAAVARTLGGELIPLDASSAGEGKVGWVKRVPIGVVAGISPFNFPLNLVCHKVAPAIAAGCPVVLKPASATPLSALKLAELLIDECGLPPGWLNVVPCAGSTANHLVEHPDVAMITFTGSPPVGWGIRARAATKKVGLELGNNAPVVIEPDGDWETAAAKIKVAGFSHAGQSCISTQRVYVHEDIAEEFTTALVKEVEALVVGDPADDSTDVSALIDAGETERVKAWIEEAEAGGAKLAAGGELTGDGILRPTVLTGVTDDMKVCALEVFGPVVAVATYTDYEDALARANDSRYGLQAGVFTKDLGKALQAADTLDFGGVLINEVPTWRADHMPYGGLRDSGNTREGPPYAVREMTEQRLIVMQP